MIDNRTYHPHLHNIVTGGAVTPEGTWKSARGNFLVSMRVLAKLFRGKFLAGLRKLRAKGELSFTGPAAELEHPVVFEDLLDSLSHKKWNVYIKRPFAGPRQVIAYLGRYTHRVAISNSRLVSLEDDRVTFRTRGNKTLTLPAPEFIRRFSLHVLPRRFVKIRHYGLHAARAINSKWELAKNLIGSPTKDPHEPDTATEDKTTAEPCPTCSACGSHNVVTTELFRQLPPRAPPTRAPPSTQLAA